MSQERAAQLGALPPVLAASSPPLLLPSPPQLLVMLRGAQVKVLNRGALRAARKNAAVFNAARTLATKAASPAVLPKVLPRATAAAAARESAPQYTLALFSPRPSTVQPSPGAVWRGWGERVGPRPPPG